MTQETIMLVRFDFLTVVKIQIEVWLLMPCSIAAGYQRFEEPCCLHLQWRQQGSSKRWYPAALVHRVITPKTMT